MNPDIAITPSSIVDDVRTALASECLTALDESDIDNIISAIHEAGFVFSIRQEDSDKPDHVVDLGNLEAGLVVVDEVEFIPGREYEEQVAKEVAARDRLAALDKARAFLVTPGGGISLPTAETRHANLVIAAAKWVLHGDD